MGSRNSCCSSGNVEVPPTYQPPVSEGKQGNAMEEVAVGAFSGSDGGLGDRARAKRPNMSAAAMRLLLPRPRVPAPLDPNFAPVVLAKRSYQAAVEEGSEGSTQQLSWALLRPGGCARGALRVFAEEHVHHDASLHLAGVLIQEMLWQRGATSLLLHGPEKICRDLSQAFSLQGRYSFEARTIAKVCGSAEDFTAQVVASEEELPKESDSPVVFGQDAMGGRLVVEIGRTEVKVAAIQDNEILDVKEVQWDSTKSDAQYFADKITQAVSDTAASISQVEAIGGSIRGAVSSEGEVTWSDLFPNVPAKDFEENLKGIFLTLAENFKGAQLRVVTDGDLTAAAASLRIREGGVLALASGAGGGAGYCRDIELPGWVNELSYVQLDLNPAAPPDPRGTGHRGTGHAYLGLRGAAKLGAAAGLEGAPEAEDLAGMSSEKEGQCMLAIQAAMKDPEQQHAAQLVYETMGVYLGYALAQFSEHYNVDHALVLSPVASGPGGMVMCHKAKEVLLAEFPELEHIRFHFPDENFHRTGRLLALAAIPPPHVGVHITT